MPRRGESLAGAIWPTKSSATGTLGPNGVVSRRPLACKRTVAQRFRVQSPHGEAAVQRAVGVDRVPLGVAPRGLPVSCGSHQEAVHPLDAPAHFRPFGRQQIEHFRMRRSSSQHAELARCVDESPPEMVQPQAVGHDPSEQRMGAARQVSGESQPPPGRFEAGVLFGDLEASAVRRGDGQVSRFDRLFRLAVVAPIVQMRGGTTPGCS